MKRPKAQPDNSSGTKRKRGQLSERIYEGLKQDILSGEIPPGTLLSEAVLGRRYEASRTPVREALNRLACDRVIVTLPQRGHLVRTVSVSEAIEAFRVRELLEVEAAGQAALRITDREVAYLKELAAGDPDGPAMVNYRIHGTIALIAGNRLLADFIEETLVLMQRMIATHPDREDLEPELQVIEALEARDPAAAREAMRVHIRDVMEKLLRAGAQNTDARRVPQVLRESLAKAG
jgi:DNA-binding GntR family transcriptional regulator